MKKIILPLALSLFSGALSAQTATVLTATPSRSNEIGLFGQSQISNSQNFLNLGGVQYKHWRNEHVGFRIIGAFAQYSTRGQEVRTVSGDTLFTRQESININLPVVGICLEKQRHFYKNVFLFAAVELKGGYGKGTGDLLFSKAGGNLAPGSETYTSVGSYDASMVYVGLTASIGAKLQYNRLVVGLELMPAQANFTKLTGGSNSGGITDLNLGTFSQRFSLGWRF